ncbi:MAG: PQQ-binding-like beta-propeller repeat protein [Planctomycetales bacterium]|nr:PQQ-binding-like beta-propeller repeat protein [Planctomycetales bacterium]
MLTTRALLLVFAASTAASTTAADWPQILGPHRNGVSSEAALTWASDSPRITWETNIGQGFAGPAVVANRVYVFHRVADQERIEAFDRQTGKSLWRTDFPAYYRGGVNPDTGPRCVPLVTQNRIVVFGAGGDLHCVAADDGKKLWSRELYEELDGKEGYFGAGSSPIAVDQTVIVNVGGSPSACLVALDLASGQIKWKAGDDDASYSSPILFGDANGTTLVCAVARLNMFLFEPNSGKIVASSPFGKRGPTVNAASPVRIGDNRVFLTASYGIGGQLLQFDRTAEPLKTIWANDESLSSQYNTPIEHDGFLYGIHGREDVGTADLVCVKTDLGQIAWKEAEFGVAHLLRVGDTCLALKLDGTIVAFAANAQQFQPQGSYALPAGTYRALPAYADGMLFVRSEKKLYSVQIGD